MHQRQSIVLEEYGLVAALEWLAEQAQERGGLVVDIELDGADVGNAAAIPPPIGRAAFRVALLALDNVVRHAAASRALIRLDIDGGRGRLAVIDDGRGIEDATAPLAGRGLIDMRTAANEVHAVFAVERGDRGTAIEMAWATPGLTAEDPASTSADITARGPGAHA
jgi:signal transduction histidine kinase